MTPEQHRKIEEALDRMEQCREDSFQKAMTDLLARQSHIEDWDQAMNALEAYREATAGWLEDRLRVRNS